ncbi:MAG: hypothetical protein IT167_08820 [Bryobacterales bacterium]|nr:hypothetical protein [Bryobacterales bacterium]
MTPGGQNNPNQVFAFVVYDATPVISSISGAVYANVASVLTITTPSHGCFASEQFSRANRAAPAGFAVSGKAQ